MSTKIPVWTWRDAIRKAAVPPATKLLCYTLSLYMTDVGRGCWPSVKALMADTGMSNTSIATHLQNAVAAELLAVSRSKGNDGRLQHYVYHPRFPTCTELPSGGEEGDGLQVKNLHEDSPGEKSSPGPGEKNTAVQVKNLHVKNTSKKELSNTPVAPKGAKGVAGKLPDDWLLPDEWRQWAAEDAPKHAGSIGREADKFADHWRSTGRRKLDWAATWRNWWRTACERMPVQRGSIQRGVGVPHVSQSSVRDTSEPMAVYRERMIREGKLEVSV